MEFAAAPEYQVFPTRERALKPYEAAVRAADETRPLVASFAPDAVVVDVLTVAGGLAAELEGRPWVTLVPHLLPTPEPGFPPYSVGARLPRTALGERLWRALDPLVGLAVRQGRRELNGARGRVGLDPVAHEHGGISRALALVATFPQLEYPRPARPPWARVTGPLLWERDGGAGDAVELPPGEAPLVLVAPSTSQDPDGSLVAAALAGLARESVRVLAVFDPSRSRGLPDVPANARLVPWLSYARAMPGCAAVVCHAGHGTLARAAGLRRPGGGVPGGGRHGGELGARGLGRRRGVAAAAAADATGRAAGGAAGAGGAGLRSSSGGAGRVGAGERRGEVAAGVLKAFCDRRE